MAWVRQLPSGLWAATVYLTPGDPGSRRTETHKLKMVVTEWAVDMEADIRRGELIDPRLSKTPVGEVWDKYCGTRRISKAARARDASIFRCHVRPRWGDTPVGRILKPDVQKWVIDLETAHADDCRSKKCEGCRHGGWVIIAALNVMKAVMELAVDAGMIRSNPARRVKAPMPPAHEARIIDPDEEEAILVRLDTLFPGRRDARLFVETLFETGARWEEIAGVSRPAVDLRASLIRLGPVMERDGTVRDYPKGARTRQAAGFRNASVSPELLGRLRPVVLATAPDGLVFTASEGGPMRYPTWLRRVWNRALRVPVLDERGRPARGADGQPLWTPLIDEPLPTPHDTRHTYGTTLANDVPEDPAERLELHDRMALMGHADVRSAMRYTHSNDSRFDRARNARQRRKSG